MIVTCNILPLLMTFFVFLGVFGVGFVVFVAVVVVYLLCLLHFFYIVFNVKRTNYSTRVSPHVFANCCFFCTFALRCCVGH